MMRVNGEAAAGAASKAMIDGLADLHARTLPGSLLTWLGTRFIGAFYEFAEASPLEYLIVERDGDQVVGACVVSAAPGTLFGRLIKARPFDTFLSLAVAAIGSPRKSASLVARQFAGRAPESRPLNDATELVFEMTHIFSDPVARRRGVGRRLVASAVVVAAENGASWLTAKTRDAPDNKAGIFYRKLGFSQLGPSEQHGKRYEMFAHRLGDVVKAKVAHGERDR